MYIHVLPYEASDLSHMIYGNIIILKNLLVSIFFRFVFFTKSVSMSPASGKRSESRDSCLLQNAPCLGSNMEE